MKHVLPFTGVPFQIEGNWVFLKGISYSVQKTGVTFKYKGQLRQFSFGEAFPADEWGAFPMKSTRTFQRHDATCLIQDSCFFLKECDTILLKKMVLSSNIDNSWALKGVLLLLLDTFHSLQRYTDIHFIFCKDFLLLKQMAAALSQAFFFTGTCVWLRKWFHH